MELEQADRSAAMGQLIRGDGLQLRQVILNTIMSAVEAMSGVTEMARELPIGASKVKPADSQRARLYVEDVAVILAHELVSAVVASRRRAPAARGGLAGWQQRFLIDYIEENIGEPILVADLARLVRLSPYHFCRAFKTSFGMPPHRYHMSRRIDRAKEMLAEPGLSVTEIGMTLDFADTSAFSTAFRKATGMTPTAYRRGLVGVVPPGLWRGNGRARHGVRISKESARADRRAEQQRLPAAAIP